MKLDGLKLYHFFRSSSSWRVRWVLRLKGIDCAFEHIDLATGDAHEDAYLAMNPLAQVPVLELKGERFSHLTETVAMLEWLDETVPEPCRLMPDDSMLRARARQLVEIINANIHALQNISTFRKHSDDEDEQQAWCQFWVGRGLKAYEAYVAETAGTYSMGDVLSMPDIYLVPICENAVRFGVDLAETPTVKRIYETARATDACRWAEPDGWMPEGWAPPQAQAA